VETQEQWDEGAPIYRQLRDRVVAMILEGLLREGDPLPSVRNVAAEFRINPLTVLKSYQQLVDEQLVEKRRGRGMFVNEGAAEALRVEEKRRFLSTEWPKVRATIARLGLSVEELLQAARAGGAEATATPPQPQAGQGEDDGEHH
jgi:GntR family transcriptional regulator